jgi:predicted permease
MRLYRALLYLYPASFRNEYGAEMCAIFAQRRREAANPFAAAVLWISAFFETLGNAIAAHLEILRQDLRYAMRALARSPGFTLTAILVAALGTGANTAAFTMVNHVLLRPFPYADQDRLVELFENRSPAAGVGGGRDDLSPANYRDWKRMSTSFESMAAYRGLSVNVVGQGEPRRIEGASVTAEMFPTLGADAAFGRVFTAGDDRETSAGTVVLSYGLWQELFGGEEGILGRKLLVDDRPYTVIGVMPKDFYFPSRTARLWTAMRFAPADFEDRTDTYIYGIARLKCGVSVEQARAEMRTVAAQLARSYPKELAHVGADVVRMRDNISSQSRLLLKALFGAAVCVLLIACTNLANLLLARAMGRRKELAVRAAIGAGRERLVRQMLTESLVLAWLGGAVGVVLAIAALPLLVRLVPVSLPIAQTPPIDLRVLLFAALVTCATGILFGVVPAVRVCRASGLTGLVQNARSGGGRRERLRSALVVVEVAGSVVLLVSCGLLIRALWRVHSVDPGFRAENVLTLRTSLAMPKYEKLPAREAFYQRVLERARRLPGVTGAAYISFLPMVLRGGIWPVQVEGKPLPFSERQYASLRFVTPGFFEAMGIPLLSGRDISESDNRDTPFVAAVSSSFVRRYWPGENPLGRHIDFGAAGRTIIGVVGDVRMRGLERSSEPQVYLSYRQHHNGVSTWYAPKDLVIRGSGNVAALVPALRQIIAAADPAQPVSDVQLLSDIVDAETTPRAVQVRALAAFAAVALLLAAIGIHGLLSFAVSSRTQEIGMRIALGAQRRNILAMVLKDGIALAGAGVVLGAGLAWFSGRQMQALLAGVEPGDPATFFVAMALCLGMALAGSLLPAWRAVRMDPNAALRAE